MSAPYDYHTAFSRTVGWVTADELEALRRKRIAIAGMGGVGGSHLLTLTRLGIGAFHLADFDTFELPNLNRQAGAAVSTLGKPKAHVLANMARDINPELDLTVFEQGLSRSNMDAFLDDMDLYVDGLDFFAVDIRRAVFAGCAAHGIPAVTAAPLGMGVALLNFLPGKMSFEDYFRLEGQTEEEQLLRFLLGLSPAMLQSGYLVDPSAVDIARHRGPSTPMACELCAGFAATQALKILLRRGPILAAPWGLHVDAYRNKCVRTWRPGGNRHPLQRLGLAIARRQFGGIMPSDAPTRDLSRMERIVDLARWAPSGDNAQPWRFEIKDDLHLVVHGRDTRDHCVYDLHGHASQIALGALMETLAIAASAHGLRTTFQRRADTPTERPTFDVRFVEDPNVAENRLLPYIRQRSTQRRRLSTRPLSAQERAILEAAAGTSYRIVWVEGMKDKLYIARLLFHNAGIRLTLPEAYEVHRAVIAWRTRYSPDRIPDQAVGLDPLTTRIMEWTLRSWGRVAFFNRYLAGTLLPRIELDVIPALGCAAHFVLVADHTLSTVDNYVTAGRAVQRLWLSATQLGLQFQPEMTPLIFASYVRENVTFSHRAQALVQAQRVTKELAALIGEETAQRAVFMGRIGAGPIPKARSTRLSLKQLLIPGNE